MTFTRYACWLPDRVHTVMNPDAEHMDSAVFLAVHSAHPLKLVPPDPNVRRQREDGQSWQMSSVQFRDEFLAPERRHVQAVVLGGSGSGKSHFIHWLALNIPERPDRHVLSIAKTGPALRGLLRQLVDILPDDEALLYRQRLDTVGYDREDQAQRRERLIDEIALAIGACDVVSADADAAEMEGWLIKRLPDFFHDPEVRRHLATDGGIVDTLVAHVEDATTTYERVEERRAFAVADLPLTAADAAAMSRNAARVADTLMGDEEYIPLAVALVNRGLETAIPRMLNFSGDQLVQLMLDIRRYLRRQGKSLVLLIEDFARLQGIDTALLQALIESPDDADDPLCELRWAMAVTSGYYERLPNTVLTRVHYVIDMDVPARAVARQGAEAALSEDDVVSFAARYLNAARLPEEQLAAWHAGVGDDADVPPPSACDGCPFRQPCHEAFGTAAGYGLYPFTGAAVLNMARRQDPDMDQRFTPRKLIKDVLADVLDLHRAELEEGRFPSDRLLKKMGGERFPPEVTAVLRRTAGEHFLRQQATLELWGELGRPVELPDGLWTAFGLPPAELEGAAAPTGGAGTGERPPRPDLTDWRTEAISAWGRGGDHALPDGVAAELRDPMFYALESYLDWDTEGLERSAFAARDAKAFRSRFIYFRNQRTQRPNGPVTLGVPVNPDDADELRQSAIALGGLLQFQTTKRWNFSGAHQALAALGECLERWSAELVRQFRALPDPRGRWDPVASAVELLAVGAALGARPVRADATLTDYMAALFDRWPDEPSAQSREWRQLYERLRSRRELLSGVVHGLAAGTKGGQAGAFLDAGHILGPLRRVRRQWDLKEVPPAEAAQRPAPFGELARLHAEVRAALEPAATAEHERKLVWLRDVRRHMAEGTSRPEIVDELRQLRAAVADGALACQPAVLRAFDQAFEEFLRPRLDEAIRSVEELRSEAHPVRALPQLARDRGAAVVASEKFFPAATALLDDIAAVLEARRAALAGAAALEADQQRIALSLARLPDVMDAIEDKVPAAAGE